MDSHDRDARRQREKAIFERIQHATNGLKLDVDIDGTPLHLALTILKFGTSDRPGPERYDHPDPFYSRLFVFETGSADITVGGREHRLNSKTLYLLPPACPFAITYNPSILHFIHVHISDITGRTIFSEQNDIIRFNDPSLCSAVADAVREKRLIAMFAGTLNAIETVIERRPNDFAEPARRNVMFAKLFEWMEHRPIADISVSDAAALYGITSAAFSKRFRRTMGMSFKQFILDKQIQDAKHMLTHTDDSVDEIAQHLGHRYSQYFHRFFKQHTGTTPFQFRQSSRHTLSTS